VGAETCKSCHEESYAKFSHTKMGRLFLNHPRDAREKNACESCHGPGRAHVEAVSDVSARLAEELDAIGRDAPVAVLPEGPMTIPYLRT